MCNIYKMKGLYIMQNSSEKYRLAVHVAYDTVLSIMPGDKGVEDPLNTPEALRLLEVCNGSRPDFLGCIVAALKEIKGPHYNVAVRRPSRILYNLLNVRVQGYKKGAGAAVVKDIQHD